VRVIETEEGFAFLFDKEEVGLGLSILNSLVPMNEESKQSVEASKFLVATVGLGGNKTIN
jgi:hypothetical protein